jgi:hypothetical protein
MDLGIPDIQAEIAREIAQHGTPIVLTWDEWPADAAPSPVDGSRAGTPTTGTQTVNAFVHYVPAAGQSSVRQFAEIEVGDVILDFADDVDLAGKENLRFNVMGQLYVQKQIGEKLALAWDVTVQGVKLFRPVLVRKAT